MSIGSINQNYFEGVMFNKMAIGIIAACVSINVVASQIPPENVLLERFEAAGIAKKDAWSERVGEQKARTVNINSLVFSIYDDSFGAVIINEGSLKKERIEAGMLICLSMPTIALNGLSSDKKKKALNIIKYAYLKPGEESSDVIDGLVFNVKLSSIDKYSLLSCSVESFEPW
ncbi:MULTISPECIES: hypothetical protein [unclassified Serratia (in: enterobacteria)]|uniref:hypothetical protein n=1 Tax=unclassified Serratia (in: enterobacteria) TaxID=2647522 RepID=UPI0027E5EB0E|nr:MULTISPECIES: hypothetical protein [unclassified Serratia (in: enterobacteria)]MDQ7097401.1 hypothetical protein [Serratia sp. MF2]MDQ7104896.1 hypothetical protein [Serratia sp. MF1(2023)]